MDMRTIPQDVFDELNQLVEDNPVRFEDNLTLRESLYRAVIDHGVSTPQTTFYLQMHGFINNPTTHVDVSGINASLTDPRYELSIFELFDLYNALNRLDASLLLTQFCGYTLLLYRGTVVASVWSSVSNVHTRVSIQSPSPKLTALIEIFANEIYSPDNGAIIRRLFVTKHTDRISTSGERIYDEYPTTLPVTTAFPTLPPPSVLWDDFSTSNSRITLLMGPPGVGKSSYAKEMINHRGWGSVYLVDSEAVMLRADFIDFVRSMKNGSVLIIEDGDRLLRKRENGNDLMSSLLNAISGVATKDVRLVINVNIEHHKDIDPAILRSGRLFSLLSFKKLTLPQAKDLMVSIDGDPDHLTDPTGYTLSDVLNWDVTQYYGAGKLTTSIGFH